MITKLAQLTRTLFVASTYLHTGFAPICSNFHDREFIFRVVRVHYFFQAINCVCCIDSGSAVGIVVRSVLTIFLCRLCRCLRRDACTFLGSRICDIQSWHCTARFCLVLRGSDIFLRIQVLESLLHQVHYIGVFHSEKEIPVVARLDRAQESIHGHGHYVRRRGRVQAPERRLMKEFEW